MLIALGGNAILQRDEKGTAQEQFKNVDETSRKIVQIACDGHDVAITHGNGPQVGDILLQNEYSRDKIPAMPLDICGAESQGMIGYMFQQCMRNELKRRGFDRPVATVITQCVVDKDDPAFQHPTKPIGPFYTTMEAHKLREERGWTIINDAERGCRRVVPSPHPKDIVEKEAIRSLIAARTVVIASGGGGVPVVEEDGKLKGIEAVIDKDLAGALLAKLIEAEIFLILTDVDSVFLNFKKKDQKALEDVSYDDMRGHLEEGQFAEGSMGPKVEAALSFLDWGGERSIITSPDRAMDAMKGNAGTIIAPKEAAERKREAILATR